MICFSLLLNATDDHGCMDLLKVVHIEILLHFGKHFLTSKLGF